MLLAGNCSLAINQSFLQLETPRKQGGFLGFWSTLLACYCTALRDDLMTEGGYQISSHWSSCRQVFSSAGAQSDSHPAESSKGCELDVGRGTVASNS